MAYEESRVVTDPAGSTVAEEAAVIERRTTGPTTVVDQRSPATRIVQTNDPVANVYAASQLIQTIVWSVVVIVLLVVALLALHVYAHLF